jgi:hypothetical protein
LLVLVYFGTSRLHGTPSGILIDLLMFILLPLIDVSPFAVRLGGCVSNGGNASYTRPSLTRHRIKTGVPAHQA